MSNVRFLFMILMPALVAVSLPAAAQGTSPSGVHSPAGRQELYNHYIANRLQLGLRLSYFQLTEDTEENFGPNGEFTEGFLGTISTLEEQQSYVPTPYLRYYFNPYVAAAVGWEHFELRTRTFQGSTDGDYIYSGPSFHIEGHYPNDSIVTPYASLGYAFLGGDVDYNPDWHRNGLRNFFMKDTTAVILGAGSQFQISDQFAIDVFLNYVRAEFDVEYKLALERTSRGEFDFPLDNWSLGITALWTF